jgi:P2-related tail formation protein
MKKFITLIALILLIPVSLFAQPSNTKVFTIFTSGGCGCTGSGCPPENFTTHAEVLYELRMACNEIDFIEWDGTYKEAYEEVSNNKDSYDGVLIIGRISGDYRLAFTGLPTVVVYNLFEFMNAQPYHLFATGNVPEKSVLKGGNDYKGMKILTARLDRRNLCDPSVTKSMFNDLVYKINLIKAVKEFKETRILMVKNNKNEIIARVNYRGDINHSFPEHFNEHYITNFKKLLGIDIIAAEPEEFYEAYGNVDVKEAEKTADKWIEKARAVEASKREIIKTARGYLALEALRKKYNCNAVSTHVRSVTGSGELKDRYNPGLGLELGFKTRGIQAVCQNYPDIVASQVLAYILTGRPSMLGDIIYDIDNSVEVILHTFLQKIIIILIRLPMKS